MRGALKEWVELLKSRGLPCSNWEVEEGVEFAGYTLGLDSFELYTKRATGAVELGLLQEMKSPVPNHVATKAARVINGKLGRDGVKVDCDEINVIHVVTMVPVGLSSGASSDALVVAEKEARFIREMFFRLVHAVLAEERAA